MIKRAWIAISGLWSLFWVALFIASTSGVELSPAKEQAMANGFFLIILIPWALGLIAKWVVGDAFD